jgi:hypothetical protein
LTSALLALDTPGLPGDTLELTAVGTTGTKGTVSLNTSNGDLSYKAPATGTSDSFTYTVTDETLETSATGTVSVMLSQALAGNGTITLSGSGNIVIGGNGNDQITGGPSNTSVNLGNGTDSVSLSGNNNTVTLGNGSSDSVTLGGTSSPVNNSAVSLGNGDHDTVTLFGNSSKIAVGSGNSDTVTVTGNNDSIMAGPGTGDVFNLHASMTSLSLNGGSDTINDTHGGTDALQLQIGAKGGTVGITNFDVATVVNGVVTHSVVSLVQALANASGWTSSAQIAAAVTSDNNGGSLLKFGSHLGSIDFAGVTGLTAKNFQIS